MLWFQMVNRKARIKRNLWLFPALKAIHSWLRIISMNYLMFLLRELEQEVLRSWDKISSRIMLWIIITTTTSTTTIIITIVIIIVIICLRLVLLIQALVKEAIKVLVQISSIIPHIKLDIIIEQRLRNRVNTFGRALLKTLSRKVLHLPSLRHSHNLTLRIFPRKEDRNVLRIQWSSQEQVLSINLMTWKLMKKKLNLRNSFYKMNKLPLPVKKTIIKLIKQ